MGAVATTPATFSDIEELYCGAVFPGKQFFKGCKTALCIFSANWYGMQDAYWIAQHGLVGTCVDTQGDKLEIMRGLYPEGWEFVEADAFEFAQEALEQGRTWDALTLDPWTSHFQICADMLGSTWTQLARKIVVLGHGNYRLQRPDAPEGWTMSQEIMRSDFKGGVYWRVYQRA